MFPFWPWFAAVKPRSGFQRSPEGRGSEYGGVYRAELHKRALQWERTTAYPALAEATIAGHPPGSSAGGERPKFGVLVGDHHMLVKFAGRGGMGDAVARRWCDLLILEGMALEIVASHGIAAASTKSSRHATIGFSKASDSIAWGCAEGSQF